MNRVVLTAVTTVFGTLLHAAPQTTTYDAKTISVAEFSNANGPITITGTEGAQASVTVDLSGTSKKCIVKSGLKGGVLEVRVGKEGWSKEECHADITAKLPTKVNVELVVGNGSAAIEKTDGEIEYKIGNGDLKVNASVTRIEGSVGNGSSEIKGLTGNGEIRIGNGKSTTHLSKIPAEGTLEIRTGMGDATVVLPGDAKFKTDYKAGNGSLKSDFTEDSSSKFVLRVRAGKGDLNIKKN